MLADERLIQASTVLISNRTPDDWYDVYPDPVVEEAIMDRIISAAIKLMATKGKSYRKGVMSTSARSARKLTEGGWRVRTTPTERTAMRIALKLEFASIEPISPARPKKLFQSGTYNRFSGARWYPDTPPRDPSRKEDTLGDPEAARDYPLVDRCFGLESRDSHSRELPRSPHIEQT